nr:hypothetical protein [Tanacetum cinerariifolium]
MPNTNMQTQSSSVLQNVTVSSCLTSNIQQKTQLSRSRCMHSLREVKSLFKFLTESIQDFGTMPIFKRTFSQDLDLLEQHLTTDILSQTDCTTTLTNLKTKFENAFNSEFKVLSKENLKGTRIEHGFKRAFMSLFRQDADTFTRTMFLNVDQLQKKPNKDEFQEDGSMAAFWFRETLLQHMSNVKKSVAERTRHQRQYDRRVNKRQMQTQESKIDIGKAVDDDLVVTESNGIESKVKDNSSSSGNDIDADDADIRPIYDEEPMAEKIESAFAKPDHMIASSSSRNSSKNMPRFSSNDMVHNHYLDEARKKTQKRDRNSKTSVMHTASLHTTTKDSKPKPKSNNQTSRSLFVSKSSCVTITAVPKADNSKCVFNANHDACITKLLKEVNSRAKIQSHKTRNRNKPVDQKSHTQIHGRQIFMGHRFSPNKTSAVYEKTSSRSDLRWKPTGRIFKFVGLSGENQVVSKSSVVTTADTYDKRQQQPDSTSSTSTLATTVTTDGTFD